jgi:AMP deaminase
MPQQAMDIKGKAKSVPMPEEDDLDSHFVGPISPRPHGADEIAGYVGCEDDEDELEELGMLGRSASTHFSYAEERHLIEVDAKYRALHGHLPHQHSQSPVSRSSSFVRAEMNHPPPPPSSHTHQQPEDDDASSTRSRSSSRASGRKFNRNRTKSGSSLSKGLQQLNMTGSLEEEPYESDDDARLSAEDDIVYDATQKDTCKPISPTLKRTRTKDDMKNMSINDVKITTTTEDPLVAQELSMMFEKVQYCRDLRDKYQTVSLQKDGDNPKDDKTHWKIYPEPPPPSWHETEKRFRGSSKKEHQKKDPTMDEFRFEDCEIPGPNDMVFKRDPTCVYQVYEDESSLNENKPFVAIPSIRDYYMDLEDLIVASSDGPAKSFAFRRLQYLEAKWNLYYLLNEYTETTESKTNPHRDFYNVRKVDTHVHHSACMNQKHLLRFIKYKMKNCPDEVVIHRDGRELTLSQVFESLNLTAYDLSIDTLDMHAHKDSFHRFDKFNLKYNPVGESRLREIFLKTDNYIQGRYLAEITKEVFQDLENSKYQMAEYRISIYGRSKDEWDKLAAWVLDNKLFSPNVRWLIQVPRLYDIYKKAGLVNTFADIVQNVFEPLFEVTKDPSTHPKLHVFLQRVVGFDSVDDESKLDRRFHRKFPTAAYWDSAQNPPYSYWQYYLYANMASINTWRQRLGYNTFELRPHAGEAGDPEHLLCTYLVAQGINHGILLRKVPFIQYLYYLDQIPIAMSPVSNNALFLTFDKNPFYSYFKRGLNVSLSSDDPLQFAYTKEALIEEYSVAALIYKLSNVDMCELARNSVLQSGFERIIKEHWIGENYEIHGPEGNTIQKTNVPNVRLAFRDETLTHELALVDKYTNLEEFERLHG